MRQRIGFVEWACIPAICLAVCTGCPLTSDGIETEEDDEGKPPQDCKYRTDASQQDFNETPIPEGFFDFDGRTCEPLGGVINYVGRPIDEFTHGSADTIVRRDGDPIIPSDLIGTDGSVGIEIAALNLRSSEPITVFCDGLPTEWNVSLNLSNAAAPKGVLTATKDHVNGGTAESTLYVYPRLTFTFADDRDTVRVFDTAAEGLLPVQLDASFPWAHTLDPNEPDAVVGFLAGVDSPPAGLEKTVPTIVDPTISQGADAICIQHQSPNDDYSLNACRMYVEDE